jgi:alpha-L-rhamnosidase
MKRVVDYNPVHRKDACSWIECKGLEPPFVVAFRNRFHMPVSGTVRIHVAADERYELFLDGRCIRRGSERGDAVRSFFDTCDVEIGAGDHVWAARVRALGDYAPLAQLSCLPGGFLLLPEDRDLEPLFGTGASPWDVRPLKGFSFDPVPYAFGIGWRECIDGFLYDAPAYRTGGGDGWISAEPVDPQRTPVLSPATLPPMLNRPVKRPPLIDAADLPPDRFDESARIAVGDGEKLSAVENPDGSFHIPPHTVRRFIFRFEDYICAYPEIRVSGGRGARLRIGFSEAACLERDPPEHPHFRYPKGERDGIAGKYLLWPIAVTCRCSGRESLFDPLWWFSGRYVEMTVETQEEALRIDAVDFFETRYPLEIESSMDVVPDEWRSILRICARTLKMCAHETYIDCPFYEQLMYVGDTRLQALTTYAVTRDSALPRKAVETFHASRLDNGLTGACHPYRGRHQIAPFSLWWIAMLHDVSLWRDPSVLTSGIFDHMHSIMDWFAVRKNSDGLVEPERIRQSGHFNFIDWVEAWNNDFGVPPGSGEYNAVLNAQWIYVLKKYAELEQAFGCPERAENARTQACEAAMALESVFLDARSGLFADDPAHRHFSEHAQCLAVLAGILPDAQARTLIDATGREKNLAPVSFYFAHYYLEACTQVERMDLFFRKLDDWRALIPQGFSTVPETPEPTRSDCHAWGAHPLFHFFASVLGIRPASFGFESVMVRPQPGPLRHVAGRMVHPRGGFVGVDVQCRNGVLSGEVTLPDHLSGQLVLPGSARPLKPGVTVFEEKVGGVNGSTKGIFNEENDSHFCGVSDFDG